MDADHSKTLSTLAIVAWRSLGRSIDQQWVDWAVSMLEKGHDSYHLRILAGEPPPSINLICGLSSILCLMS